MRLKDGCILVFERGFTVIPPNYKSSNKWWNKTTKKTKTKISKKFFDEIYGKCERAGYATA